MVIYLVRHVQYQNPDHIIPIHLPLPLSDVGQAHAQRLGQYFQNKGVEAIHTSPIRRAVETAEIINEHLNVSVTPSNLFVEVIKPELQGKPRVGITQCIFTYDGGETLEDIRSRTLEGLDLVLRTGQTSIIVSHGDPISILFHSLIDEPVPHKPTPGGDCYIKKGSIIKLEFDQGRELIGWENIHPDSY